MTIDASATRKGTLATTLLASLFAVFLAATPAAAAVDDSFYVYTTDQCGAADFVDYGPGAPGGGNNDDYVLVHDYCADSHGVRAYAWLNGTSVGSRYNGNGLAGDPVVWDPFGNVLPGAEIWLKVCLVDGTGDTSGARCSNLGVRTSTDG